MVDDTANNHADPPSSSEGTAGDIGNDGGAVASGGGGRTEDVAACGGPAVHGDWYLGGNSRAVEDYVNQAREFLEYSRIYLADGHLH